MGSEKSISAELRELAELKSENGKVHISDILNRLKDFSFGILMIVFSIPVCAPVPLPPGVSTLFSIPLIFFSLQVIFGRHTPWFPKFILRSKIKMKYLKLLIELANPIFKFLEKQLGRKSRIYFSEPMQFLLGVFWLVFSLVIAVPIPMIGFLPSLGIILSAFGLLNKDGVMVFSGFMMGMIGAFVAISAIFLIF